MRMQEATLNEEIASSKQKSWILISKRLNCPPFNQKVVYIYYIKKKKPNGYY